MERELAELHRKVVELQRSQARYESLFENAPISLWDEDYSEVKKLIDELRRSGVEDWRGYFEAHPDVIGRCAQLVRVLDVNRATVTMYHAERKEQILAGVPTIFGQETFASFREQMIEFAQGKTSFECEAMTRALDGVNNRVLVNILIPAGYEGTWERAFVAILDITARVRAKEAELLARAQEETIRAQRDALGSLSTPVIPISDEIIVMPLVGVLDSRRMAQVTETLLDEVGRRRATIAIVDITGVPGVDSAVAGALIRLAQAVKLLGAKVMLTGIRAEVAQVLVELGVSLGDILTHGTLQAGIAYATRR
jgi:rsbT co-antagonist protein RsbR